MITDLLLNHYQENHSLLKNEEICYLITNFFFLTYKRIPDELANTFIHHQSYDRIQNCGDYFTEIKFHDPVILSIKAAPNASEDELEGSRIKNGFYFEYLSQHALDQLEYKKDELINEELHKLFPSQIIEQHIQILQKHLFLFKEIQVNKIIFLITKSKYFKRLQLQVGLLPTIRSKILLICDFIFINDDTMRHFKFLLDINSNFITFTENFVKRYRLTSEMLTKFDISFCQLFGINLDKIQLYFKDKIDYFRMSNSLSIEKYIGIFSSCKLKNFLNINNNVNAHHENQTADSFLLQIEKAKIVNSLSSLQKQMEESKIHIYSIMHIQAFGDLLAKESYKNSTFIEFKIELKHIGNYPYFMITMTDNDIQEGGQFLQNLHHPQKNNKEKILNKMNVNLYKESKYIPRNNSIDQSSLYKSISINNETNDYFNNQSSVMLSVKKIRIFKKDPQTKSVQEKQSSI